MRFVAGTFSFFGLSCTILGLLVDGTMVEFVGIFFGASGYYFGLCSGDWLVQVPGAAIPSVIPVFVSGPGLPPQ